MLQTELYPGAGGYSGGEDLPPAYGQFPQIHGGASFPAGSVQSAGRFQHLQFGGFAVVGMCQGIPLHNCIKQKQHFLAMRKEKAPQSLRDPGGNIVMLFYQL